MNIKNPKVFISHASEDKDRFVLEFAKKLRAKGIDAWLDKWEMKLGDSLVDKIFEEGIKNCDVFIIILSKYSVNKKWVKEELNSAVVKRIEEKTRIIPIIIDENIEVPISLKHLVWVKIKNLSNYEKEFQQILKDIYEVTEKPPLGLPPKFSQIEYSIPNYTKIDAVILKIIGDIILRKNDLGKILSLEEILQEAEKYEIPKEEVIESLEIVEGKGIIKIKRFLGREIIVIMSPYGLITYCEYFLETWENIFKNTIAVIINENLRSNHEISKMVGCDLVIIDSLLDYFDERGYLKRIKAIGGLTKVIDITAEGRRYFKNVLHGV